MGCINEFLLRHYRIKMGTCLTSDIQIGSGLKICHYPGVVINGSAKIGKNATIYQGGNHRDSLWS